MKTVGGFPAHVFGAKPTHVYISDRRKLKTEHTFVIIQLELFHSQLFAAGIRLNPVKHAPTFVRECPHCQTLCPSPSRLRKECLHANWTARQHSIRGGYHYLAVSSSMTCSKIYILAVTWEVASCRAGTGRPSTSALTVVLLPLAA